MIMIKNSHSYFPDDGSSLSLNQEAFSALLSPHLCPDVNFEEIALRAAIKHVTGIDAAEPHELASRLMSWSTANQGQTGFADKIATLQRAFKEAEVGIVTLDYLNIDFADFVPYKIEALSNGDIFVGLREKSSSCYYNPQTGMFSRPPQGDRWGIPMSIELGPQGELLASIFDHGCNAHKVVDLNTGRLIGIPGKTVISSEIINHRYLVVEVDNSKRIYDQVDCKFTCDLIELGVCHYYEHGISNPMFTPLPQASDGDIYVFSNVSGTTDSRIRLLNASKGEFAGLPSDAISYVGRICTTSDGRSFALVKVEDGNKILDIESREFLSFQGDELTNVTDFWIGGSDNLYVIISGEQTNQLVDITKGVTIPIPEFVDRFFAREDNSRYVSIHDRFILDVQAGEIVEQDGQFLEAYGLTIGFEKAFAVHAIDKIVDIAQGDIIDLPKGAKLMHGGKIFVGPGSKAYASVQMDPPKREAGLFDLPIINQLFDLSNRRFVSGLDKDRVISIEEVVFSADGAYVSIKNYDGSYQVLDIEAETLVTHFGDDLSFDRCPRFIFGHGKEYMLVEDSHLHSRLFDLKDRSFVSAGESDLVFLTKPIFTRSGSLIAFTRAASDEGIQPKLRVIR